MIGIKYLYLNGKVPQWGLVPLCKKSDTMWLTQTQMAQLFKSSRTNVLEHIQHIYEVEELEKEATCRNFRQVRQEGKRMVNRTMTMYNLDMIISVGYRVNSKRGVKFRQWLCRAGDYVKLKGCSNFFCNPFLLFHFT